jgi:response regulator of citrate/malate metabolism
MTPDYDQFDTEMLDKISDLLQRDYGAVYSPSKVSNILRISSDQARKYLDILVEKKEIERLSYGSFEPNFGLYCCEKPKYNIRRSN